MAPTLLTVETEANGDSRSVLLKEVLLRLVRWARCTGKRDVCPDLQAGQAVVLGHLSLNVCLWEGREE